MSNRIDEIRQRWARATPGPWHADKYNRVLRQTAARRANVRVEDRAINFGEPYTSKAWVIARFPHRTGKYPISHEEWEANQDALGHAPTDIAYLLAEVERLQSVNKQLYLVVSTPEKRLGAASSSSRKYRDEDACPLCNGLKLKGHNPGCPIAAALRGGEDA